MYINIKTTTMLHVLLRVYVCVPELYKNDVFANALCVE